MIRAEDVNKVNRESQFSASSRLRAKVNLIKLFWLICLSFLLAGCFNDIQGPEGSHVWVADKFSIEHYRGDNGEPLHTFYWQTGVLDMAADVRTGLFWVIRDNGSLAAYDHEGTRQHDLQVELGRRPKQVLLSVHQDVVWLASERSLTVLESGVPQWRQDLPKDLVAISHDRERNRLWVLTKKNLLVFDENGNELGNVTLPNNIGNARSLAWNVVHDRVVVVSNKGLYSYSADGTPVNDRKVNKLEQVVADVAGNLWAAENKKLLRIDASTLAVTDSLNADNRITQLRQDPFNPGVWVLAEDAVAWVDGRAQLKGRFFIGYFADVFAVSYENAAKPELSILQPQEGAVVGTNPEFVLTATDNVGVDTASFVFTVNEVPSPVNCQADTAVENQFRCLLQSSLFDIAPSGDGRYRITVTVNNTAGNTSEPAVVNILLDRDGDGAHDGEDFFPDDPAESSDLDGDGIGDNADPDRDGDGISNDYEDQVGTDPNNPNDTPPDLDGDGIPDSLDDDRDGDGVGNEQDVFPDNPAESSDLDGDGVGDNSDPDRDGDGVDNEQDAFPNNPSESSDLDGDGIGDNSDPDRDGDGVNNDQDAFPNNPTESSDLDGDGIGDNSDPDRDGDGVTNEQDAFPNDPSESSDLDGDGIGDNSDPDRDGDGVNNDQDAFPNDPDRTKLPAVLNQTATLDAENERVSVQWQPPANTENVETYTVYRITGEDGAPAVIASALTETSLTDADVQNGQLYRYRVVAVTGNGLEGDPAESAELFVAFNNTPVQGLSAQRTPVSVQLQWTVLEDYRYRIYRAPPDDGALLDVDTNEYLDVTALWQTAYSYRIASLLDLTHPVSGETVTVEGPVSAPIAVEALPPLTIAVSDTTMAGDGVLEQVVLAEGDVSVSGEYSEATGPVTVTAMSGANTVSVDGTPGAGSGNGTFRLVLPDSAVTSGAVWTLTATETAVADREVTVNLRINVDGAPPVITLDNPAHTATENDVVTVSGTVTDNSGIIHSLSIVSDRFAGTPFTAIQGDNNRFQAEVPLLFGPNVLTVTALDQAGNLGQSPITVDRKVGVAPIIEISAPANGAIVATDRIAVSGRLYTSLEPEQIRVVLGEQILFPEAGAVPGVYDYSFGDIRLQPGLNNLNVRAETTAGNASALVAVIYRDQPADPGQDLAPVIQVSNPNLNSHTRQDSIVIAGFVTAAEGPVALSINGTPVDLIGQNNAQGYFQYLADLSGIDGEAVFKLVATDAANRNSEREVTIIRDVQEPLITLSDGSLQAAPAINEVITLPYRLQGQVDDAHLAGLSINDNPVALTPTAQANVFAFNAALNLPVGEARNVLLTAWDYAGNRDTHELVLNANPQTTIEIIRPLAGTTLALSGASPTVVAVARLSLVEPGYTVTARIDQDSPVTMLFDANVVSADVPIDLSASQHTLTITVTDSAAQQVAVSTIAFNSEDLANIPLALKRSEPANQENGVEPNSGINLYFNKPIELSRLQINVRETVNGLTFDTSRPEVTDFPTLENAEPIEVHRNQEPVPGETGILPGNTVVTWFPESDIAYGADVYVDVLYDGSELGRLTFKVRPIPTFLQGVVTDQIGQPVAGVRLMLEGSGTQLTAQTDSNGSYTFGFGLSATETLPSGRRRITVNPDMASPKYGTIVQWANIQEGRLNRQGNVTLPLLDTEIPFRPIQSGQSQAILADGELLLDLSDTDLQFTNGRTNGEVHVQFTSAQHLSHRPLPSAMPQWLFAVQPAGIQVSGQLGLTIEMPSLMGSYLYVPPNGTHVVMIGLDPDSLQLVPVGVGTVQDQTVTAMVNDLRVLDYLGYAIVNYDRQPLLQRYVDGEIDLNDLIRELESSAGL